MIYKWKRGCTLNADAESVASELDKLENKTPKAALEYARKHKKSALHGCVTWDDAVAAEKCRLDEMRYVIRSVVVVAEDEKSNTEMEYRAFEYVDTPDEENEGKKKREFMPTEKALDDVDFREQIFTEIMDAIAELEAKVQTYQHLSKTRFKRVSGYLKKASTEVQSARARKAAKKTTMVARG